MNRQAPKLERKELATIRAVMPNWLRGQDLKLAQGAIKLITGVCRIVSAADASKPTDPKFPDSAQVVSDFEFEFKSNQEGKGYRHDVVMDYVASSPSSGNYLTINYRVPTLPEGHTAKQVESFDEVMPVAGLIAKLNDQLRLNHDSANVMLLNAISAKDLIDNLVKMLEMVQDNCTVIEVVGELEENSSFSFALVAKNNHGRVFQFVISV